MLKPKIYVKSKRKVFDTEEIAQECIEVFDDEIKEVLV